MIQEAFQKLRLGTDVTKVGFYTPKEFRQRLFDWAANDPEGGELERAKPRKQNIDFGRTPESLSERQASEREMLAEMARIMARNRQA